MVLVRPPPALHNKRKLIPKHGRNWRPAPAGSSGPPGQFAAQLWDETTDAGAVPAGAPVMGFNEPDGCHPGQACMSMDVVMSTYILLARSAMPAFLRAHTPSVRSWMSKAVPLLRKGHRIGSPAPAGKTVEWLSEFFSACDARAGCVRPSFITMHAYVTTADALKSYVVSPLGL